MKKDYGPKPLVEEHYHVQELIDRQQKRSEDRTYHLDKAKVLAEREELIREARVKDLLDFWCDQCEKDIKSVAVLQVEEDWSNPSQRIAFYQTKCFQGHWLIRHVTDKYMDRYWFRSRGVARDRGKHMTDMVQPWEDGFHLLYGRKH